jgi:hypothetical protein
MGLFLFFSSIPGWREVYMRENHANKVSLAREKT